MCSGAMFALSEASGLALLLSAFDTELYSV